jgi:lambda family phage portal protein
MASKPHIRLRMDGGEDGFHRSGGLPTSYDGASVTARDMRAWLPARRSADAEILPELGRLVSRARDSDRNNPIALGARRTLVDNVVGTGPRLSPQPDYRLLGQTKEWADEWGAQMQSLFHSWWWTTKCHAGDTLTGDQLAQQALGAAIMNGDAVTLPLWLPERGDGYSTKLQMVESDRLSNPAGAPDTQFRRAGVSLDAYGAPIAYDIRTTHPGDFLVSGLMGNFGVWEHIPRKTDFGRLRVIHYFDAERAPQTRGKPLMTTILPQLKNMDRYVRAEIDAAVANSMIAGLITTPLDNDSILQLFSKDHREYLKARSEHAVRLEGGMLATLFPGDQLQSFIPGRPNTGFGAFVENIYRIAGVGADLNYELITKDFSKTTYTSGRMSLLEAWRAFNRRRDSFSTLWLDPVYGLISEEFIDSALIDAPGFEDPVKRYAYLRCKWIFPGRGWVDPVKEAVGAATRLDSNLSTLEEECAQQGLFWRDVVDQRATEIAYMNLKGVPSVATTTSRATIKETPESTDQAVDPNADPNAAPADQGAPAKPANRVTAADILRAQEIADAIREAAAA